MSVPEPVTLTANEGAPEVEEMLSMEGTGRVLVDGITTGSASAQGEAPERLVAEMR